MDATLTATGVIATILSVIFAFAAYFVQRKKNNPITGSSKAAKDTVASEEAHVSTTRHGVSQEKKRQSQIESDLTANQQTHQEDGPKPLFKKYSTKSGYEEDAVFSDEDEALWE